jgi:hypothetical protein
LLGLVVAPRDDTRVDPVGPSTVGVTAVAAVSTVRTTGQNVLSRELEFDFASGGDAESVGYGFNATKHLNQLLVPVRQSQFVLPNKNRSSPGLGCPSRIRTATSTFVRRKCPGLQRRSLCALSV